MDNEETAEASGKEILALLIGAFPEGTEFTLKQAWTALLKAKATRAWPELTEKRVSKVLWNAAQKRLGTPPSLWMRGEGLSAVYVFKDARWCLNAWEPQDVDLWSLRRLALKGIELADVVAEPTAGLSVQGLQEELAEEAERRAERAKYVLASQDPDRKGVYGKGQEIEGIGIQNAGRGERNLSSSVPPADVAEAIEKLEAEEADLKVLEGLERVDICAHVPPEVAEKICSREISGFSMGASVRRDDEDDDGGSLRDADGGGGEGQRLEGGDEVHGGSGTGDGVDPAPGEVRPVPSEAPGEAARRADAIRYNVVYNEHGERIPGIRFAPFFYHSSDGSYKWTGVSIVSFPEDVDG